MKTKKEYLRPETDIVRQIIQGHILVSTWAEKSNNDEPEEDQGGVRDYDDESINAWGGSW